MQKFLNQIGNSFLSKALYLATQLLINIALAHKLGSSNSSHIFYVLNALSLVIMLAVFNVDNALNIFASTPNSKPYSLANAAILFAIFTASIATILFYFTSKSLEIVGAFMPFFIFIYIVSSILILYISSLLLATRSLLLPNLAISCVNILFLCWVYTSVKSQLSSHNIIIALSISYCLQTVLLLLFFYKFKLANAWVSLPFLTTIRPLLKFAIVGFTANFIFFLVYRIDYFFVNILVNNQYQLGNYIQASKMAQLLLIGPQIMASFLSSQLVKLSPNFSFKAVLKNLVILYAILFACCFLFCYFFGNFWVNLLFGNSYNSLIVPLLVLLPGIFCLSVSSIFSAFFSSKNKQGYNLYAAIVALFVLLIGTFFCKNIYSITIAAMLSSIAYFTEFLFCFFAYKRLVTFAKK
jgi:O-antigen/teichoic acid export membrane protein